MLAFPQGLAGQSTWKLKNVCGPYQNNGIIVSLHASEGWLAGLNVWKLATLAVDLIKTSEH